MELLKAASQALQRHAANVALYIGANTVVSLAMIGIAVLMRQRNPEFLTNPTTQERIIDVVTLFVASAVWSVVQTVVFSRIGRELDRPLWKVADDREALRRFFPMWFEFNLVVNTLLWIGQTIGTFDAIKDAAALPQLFAIAGMAVLVPFGAAFMFHGHFSWNLAGEGLAPIGRRFAQFAVVFALTVLQIAILLILDQPLPESIDSSLLQVILYKLFMYAAIAYLDCLIFTATWLICKDDRDSPDEFDLDF